MNPLDRPIWAALATRQAHVSTGGARAKRYMVDVEPFIAAADNEPESLAALAGLIEDGEELLTIQAGPVALPPGICLTGNRAAVQMIAKSPVCGPCPDGAEPLGDADVQEMMTLAGLTKPGPFRQRTHTLGQFWGIRRDGRLVAMAGERMKLPELTELSGVCVHSDWRGHGYARALSMFVVSEIVNRGETPFLHAYADNAAAIRLYESLGFVLRSDMRALVMARGQAAELKA